MIEIFNISKKFDEFEALKNVSFNVNNGEIVGLLGENGAGKSTLLRIISTMLTPTSGTVKINKLDLKTDQELVRSSIGILFGNEVGLYERLTARENLDYFAKLNGLNPTQSKERIENLTVQFEFEDYIDKLVGKMSKGMKQKIAIARSIIHDPNVILFDEPDSGLDFSAAKIVFDFLEYCKKSNKSIIFSSHSMENIKNFSNKIVVLHKGLVVDSFSVSEYTSKYTDKQINDILFNLVCDNKEKGAVTHEI